MDYVLNINNQLKHLFERKDFYTQLEYARSQEYITDFKDGSLYKSVLESEDGKYFNSKAACSFLINTDGIQISLKSKTSVWPVYLVINEIPIQNRFLNLDWVILK